MRYFCLFILLFIFRTNFLFAQLEADAGPDQTICPSQTVQIGSSTGATGGKPPYTYSWTPATGLSNTSAASPQASPTSTTTYTLIVTDNEAAVDTDYVTVTMHPINEVSAGNDTTLCGSLTTTIGGPKNFDNSGITYSWAPSSGLNNPDSPYPVAQISTTITYTLTATVSGCPAKTDEVTFIVSSGPVIDAGPNVTIKEGEVVTLHATGGTTYVWEPQDSVKYPFTSDPDVSPSDTTVFYVFGYDPTNVCNGKDSVIVFVEKSNDIIIYNTFTPNGDGSNDVWHIANIQKYPDSKLEVYSRNGRIVYKTTGYLNTWTGKSSGEELPEGTYFYILDLGNGKNTYHGTVTIIR